MRTVSGLLVCLLLILLLGACDNDDEADPTPRPTSEAVPETDSDPRAQGRPAPTATLTNLPGPATLLIDLDTGQRLALNATGERVGRIAFSPDGRWLVFYSIRGLDENRTLDLRRVDLGSEELQIEHFYSDGLIGRVYPSDFSSRGDLAFLEDDEGESWPAVMRPDGAVHRLAHDGHVTSWSPDGRWLTYETPYRLDQRGNEVPIFQFLVDTETWTERKIGESAPCHCDGNPRPVWAPDGAKFIYTYLRTNAPSVSEVHFPDAGTSTEIERSFEWLDSENYITRQYDRDTQASSIEAVELATGRRTRLIESADGGLYKSPTNTLFFASGKLLAPGGEVVASVPGGFRGYSPDGHYVVTFSHGTSCGRGYRVQAIDGTLIGCGPYPEEGSPFDFDIKNTAFAYSLPVSHEVDFQVDVYVLEFAAGERRLIHDGFVARSRCVELSPDGRFLVVGHACGL
jgi:Tol biopolymer transport system component